MGIECLCIDDSGRPKEVPIEKWVKKGNIYTIIWIYSVLNKNQKGIKGCDLAEISLDESNSPYEFFKLHRFAIRLEDLLALIEMISTCSDGKLVLEDINKMVKESELVLIETT